MELAHARRVLAVGAHPDDIEMGCGGTLLRMKQSGCALWSIVMSRCEDEAPTGRESLREEESIEASRRLGVDKTLVLRFENRRLPDHQVAMMGQLETVQKEFAPDLVFIPYLEDSHQDHAALAWACVRTFRKRETILQYEILRFGSHTFTPTLFVDITQTVDAKCAVLRSFTSQFERRAYFDEESFRSLARTRGAQSGYDYAEGFVTYKQYW